MTEASGSKRCVGPRDEFDIRHLSMGCLQGESGRHYQHVSQLDKSSLLGRPQVIKNKKGDEKKEGLLERVEKGRWFQLP